MSLPMQPDTPQKVSVASTLPSRRDATLLCAAGALCLVLPACSLFDTTVLDRQRAELTRLRQEADALRRETEALQRQRTEKQRRLEACNRAFGDFDAGRKAEDPTAALAHYHAGLRTCPSDDVAHFEVGEIYLKLGRHDAARAAFAAALDINPGFSLARQRLDELGTATPPRSGE